MSYFTTPRAFCDESDGSPVFDGTSTVLGFVPAGGIYTITRPLLCSTLSVTGTAVLRMTNGSNTTDFFCARRLYVEAGAKVLWNGNDGAGALGGLAITNGGSLNSAGGSGGAGGNNAAGGGPGGSGGSTMGGSGGNGGAAGGNAGGTGNASSALGAAQQRMFRSSVFGSLHRVVSADLFGHVNGSGGGGGGGGLNNAGTGVGGGGGGSATLGVCHVGIWEVYGTVGATGGKGADGAVTGNGVAGGGGGGSGGSLWIEADYVVSRGNVIVTGGLGGQGAGGGGNGSPGVGGTIVFLVGGRLG